MRNRTDLGPSFDPQSRRGAASLLRPTAIIALVYVIIYLIVPNLDELKYLFGGGGERAAVEVSQVLSDPARLRDLFFDKFLGMIVTVVLVISVVRWWRIVLVEPASLRARKIYAVLPALATLAFLVGQVLIMTALPAEKWSVFVLQLLVLGVSVLIEEFSWRGVILVGLRGSGFPEWSVWLITSLGFGAMHLLNVFSGASFEASLTQAGFTFLLGTACYLARRVGGLWFAIALHFLNNTLQTSASLLGDPSQFPVISGLAAGGMLLMIVAVPATILLLILEARKRRQQPANAAA